MLFLTTISSSRSASATMPPSVIIHNFLRRATKTAVNSGDGVNPIVGQYGLLSSSLSPLVFRKYDNSTRYIHSQMRHRGTKKAISKITPFPLSQSHRYNLYILQHTHEYSSSSTSDGEGKEVGSAGSKKQDPKTKSTAGTGSAETSDKKESATFASVDAMTDHHHTPPPPAEYAGSDIDDHRKKSTRERAELEGYVFKSKKPRRDVSLERNFITPVRAMSDFLLKSSDLEGLRKTMRRSPHPDEPPITVYWRKDVEAKAAEVWGNLNDMLAERLKREVETHEYNEAVFNVKRILKKYRQHTNEQIQLQHSREVEKNDKSTDKHAILGNLTHGSGKIVLTAISINGSNFVIKLIAWTLTGSHSLFAEAIHSMADTINQCILAYGIHKSSQKANLDHPYGYANMRHVASLISGVGIFCIGAGLSIYHGIHGLIYQEEVQSLYWAFIILAGSFLSESATLFLAVNAVRKRAKAKDISFRDFILRGIDPSLNVVILEDTAAVTGVAVAATCMALTLHYGSPIPDAVGSLVIGGLLGGVASFIIYSNSAALVGRSIPRENLDRINAALEADVMIRAIHDVKGIDMGNTQVRYKAEVDFDGRELTRAYLDKLDLMRMLEEVRAIKNTEEFESYLLHHGENIVDTLGAEIDRIETKLKKDYPEVRHCDLEIL